MDTGSSEFAAIGSLADPVRRRLYLCAAASDDGVGREEAAREVGVPVHTARFHLDKLVEEGLLEVDHRRLSGRTGPGAGRPAKVYRRSGHEVSVSLPPREYDLVGHVLAAAVEQSLDGVPIPEALTEAARAAGRRDGLACEREGGELARSAQVLSRVGFEPTRERDDLVLRNCPFDALARQHTALVCGVNRDYIAGVLEGLGCQHTAARLDPAPNRCCVRVEGSGDRA